MATRFEEEDDRLALQEKDEFIAMAESGEYDDWLRGMDAEERAWAEEAERLANESAARARQLGDVVSADWKENYLNAGEPLCPDCGNAHVEETNAGFATSLIMWANFVCRKCGFRWREWSRVMDIQELEEDRRPMDSEIPAVCRTISCKEVGNHECSSASG